MFEVIGGVRGVSHFQGDGRGRARSVSHVQGDGRGARSVSYVGLHGDGRG